MGVQHHRQRDFHSQNQRKKADQAPLPLLEHCLLFSLPLSLTRVDTLQKIKFFCRLFLQPVSSDRRQLRKLSFSPTFVPYYARRVTYRSYFHSSAVIIISHLELCGLSQSDKEREVEGKQHRRLTLQTAAPH